MKYNEEKRQNIIEAAIEEFSLYGFEGARTTRIAQTANVSSRTLYKHFETKEVLFHEIVNIIIMQTGAIASHPYDHSKPLREQLIKALSDYIGAITDERYISLTRMAMTECLRDMDLARRMFTRAEMGNNPVRKIIIGALAHGAVSKVNPDYATELLTAVAKALFFWPKFLIGAEAPQELALILDDSVDMFLSRYGQK